MALVLEMEEVELAATYGKTRDVRNMVDRNPSRRATSGELYPHLRVALVSLFVRCHLRLCPGLPVDMILTFAGTDQYISGDENSSGHVSYSFRSTFLLL